MPSNVGESGGFFLKTRDSVIVAVLSAPQHLYSASFASVQPICKVNDSRSSTAKRLMQPKVGKKHRYDIHAFAAPAPHERKRRQTLDRENGVALVAAHQSFPELTNLAFHFVSLPWIHGKMDDQITAAGNPQSCMNARIVA
jgi:hypothetical protein